MTRKLGLVVLIAALCACSGELEAMTPGTPDSSVPDAGTPDSSVPQAPAADCTDGDDCRCDRLQDPADALYDPNIVFCEDMENPEYDGADPAVEQGGRAWRDRYGPANATCTTDTPGQFGLEWDYTDEGTCPNCCINIVEEGACEAAGETDCVFDGRQTLGHRLRAANTGAIAGAARFPKLRTFGYTMAVKWSSNYVTPGEPGSGPAHKMNQFGDNNHALIGASTSYPTGRNHPFGGGADTGNPSGFNILVGDAGINPSGAIRYGPDPSVYEWGRTHGPGQWVCLQIHWRNWGRADAEVRGWMDGQLVFQVQNINMTSMQSDRDTDGIDGFSWNHYYNDGYPNSVGYRWEDNVVVTSGNEPVSCGAIGFTDDMLAGSR